MRGMRPRMPWEEADGWICGFFCGLWVKKGPLGGDWVVFQFREAQ